MIISQETQTILKNFATIEKKILLTPGNKLWTRTTAVFAEATVAEQFPIEVGIFDLTNFLSVLSLFDEPDLDFGDDFMTISDKDGKTETRYLYAAPGLVTMVYPKKLSEVPTYGINFSMTEEQWTKIQKATGVFDKHELKIVSDGEQIRIATADHKNDHGNSFSMLLEGNPNGVKCNMVFEKSNMNLIKGAYNGTVTSSFTIFRHASGLDLYYYVGSNPASVYGEDAE